MFTFSALDHFCKFCPKKTIWHCDATWLISPSSLLVESGSRWLFLHSPNIASKCSIFSNFQFSLDCNTWFYSNLLFFGLLVFSKTDSDDSNRRYMFIEWNLTLHVQYTQLLQNLQLAWQGDHIKWRSSPLKSHDL